MTMNTRFQGSAKKSRVLLLVPQRVLCELLPQHLARTRRFQVVVATEDPGHLPAMVAQLQPDLLLIDVGFGATTNFQSLAKINNFRAAVRIIFINAAVDPSSLKFALRAGVAGYLAWDSPVSELISAMERVLAGDVVFGASVARLIEKEYLERAGDVTKAKEEVLSAREHQIMSEIERGYRTKEIAEHLSLSCRTVEKHRENILKKNGHFSARATQ